MTDLTVFFKDSGRNYFMERKKKTGIRRIIIIGTLTVVIAVSAVLASDLFTHQADTASADTVSMGNAAGTAAGAVSSSVITAPAAVPAALPIDTVSAEAVSA